MLSRHARAMRGMTFIELVVTMAIGAMLIFAVAPDIGAWMRNLQVRNTGDTLLAGLQRARNEAVKRNTPVRFSLVSLNDPATMDNTCAMSDTAGSWVVSMLNPAGKCGVTNPALDPMIIDLHPIADGGRYAAITALQTDGVTAANSVTFDSFGRATTAGDIARIDVRHATTANSRPLRIVVTSGGSVRMCDPAVSNTSDPRKC